MLTSYVSVKVPCIDSEVTDHKRLPCVIVEVLGKIKTLYRYVAGLVFYKHAIQQCSSQKFINS